MKEIVYLLGAGASANALPVVEYIPHRIQYQIEMFNNIDYKLDDDYFPTFPNLSKYELQKEYVEKLRWLRNESGKHASIDTFAKKLSIIDDSKSLKELKSILSIFFVIEQKINKPDRRYDAFFASILSEINQFPKNIKIISWNYDLQFELAYSEYTQNESISNNIRYLNVNYKNGENFYKNGFFINKLNGTAAYFDKKNYEIQLFHDNSNSLIDKKFIEDIIQQYVNLKLDKFNPLLSFAWEEELKIHNKGEIKIIEQTIKNVDNSEILVVIGYSFPFFNREIDRKIIKAMPLKKVYFQAPNPNDLKERFQAIRNDIDEKNLVLITNTEQFYLPNEL